MRGLRWVWLPLLLALGSGCSGESVVKAPEASFPRTDGGAVVLSRDERIAVVTNRSEGVVTVVSLARDGANMVWGTPVEVDIGEDAEPWAAVIGADDDTAYVVLRNRQQVVRISALRSTPVLDGAFGVVGSEPSDVVISPSGERLFVANWGEGTISMLTTADLAHEWPKTDLNKVLAETGVLGTLATRPALAHPYALAVSNDGDTDDDDEKLYATEFFSQPLPGVVESPDLAHVDKNRQGFVYAMRLTGQVEGAIPILPVAETGFVDGENRMTSCFPNQLYGATVDNGLLHVTAMCTSPRGPLGPTVGDPPMPTVNNFKTLFHPTVFVLDVTSDPPRVVASQLLTQPLSAYYDAGEHGTDPNHLPRMPLIPNDIAFQSDAGGRRAFVSALGASAVFRLDYDDAGSLLGVGSPEHRYIDTGTIDGLPVGVAASRTSTPPFALAMNEAMQRLAIIDVGSEAVSVLKTVQSPRHAADPVKSAINDGRKFFATGLDVWSLKGQAWGSCEACHPGGLSDGVTWYFARGPRRTLSAANTYDKTDQPSRRMMLWGANIDEVHDIEGIVRSVTGGVGAVVWSYSLPKPSSDCRLLFDGSPTMGSQSPPCMDPKPTTNLHNGLNGALSGIVSGTSCTFDQAVCDGSVADDWNDIDAFLRSLRPPRAPTGLETADIEAGRKVFRDAKCSGCHSGPHWSLSSLFYTPGAATNGAIPYVKNTTRPPLGSLVETPYAPPLALLALNPPAAAAGGSATLRSFAPANQTDETVITYAYDSKARGNDQLQCALRDVGTFPPQVTPTTAGIAPEDVPIPIEVRQDGKTLAQGINGFNIPSLFGLAVGAPYFHAGNARTLEELFNDGAFRKHHRALVSTFLDNIDTRQEQIRQLVVFLLSIDASSELEVAPADLGDPSLYDFCR